MQNVLHCYFNDPQFDRQEAIRLLRLALSIDDSDPETLARAAIISSFMVGDYEGAIEWLTGLSSSTQIHLPHGTAGAGSIEIAGLPEEAVRSFERALRLSPIDRSYT